MRHFDLNARPARQTSWERSKLRAVSDNDLARATSEKSRNEGVYSPPRTVTDLNDCYFYHTMEIPGYGLVEGEWDLREGIRAYLGNVDLRGKRVLEMGTANGFVCFHMEREGADVVAYDLSEKQDWDVVPFARQDEAEYRSERKDLIRRLNNAFWLGHRAYKSHSEMVYGDAYGVPEDIGAVDVCTFGSILLHLRDPFLALQKALRLTRETVIITDLLEPDMADSASEHEPGSRQEEAGCLQPSAVPQRSGSLRRLAKYVATRTPVLQEVLADRSRLRRERDELLLAHRRSPQLPRPEPQLKFLPDWRTSQPRETWWHLSPDIVKRYVGILGFESTEVTYHTQKHSLGKRSLFTVVGHRTAGPFA